MKFLKLSAAMLALIFATGCANQAAQDYYLAMQQAAIANAQQSEARYRALATVASSGDQQTAIAATMAIALTDDRVIVPQYVESEPLKWAQVLAAPVAAVAGLYIQADVAKNASDNAYRVQLAGFETNQAIQLGQQVTQRDMVLGLGDVYAQGSAASAQAISTLGQAGFSALNTAGSQTVELGTAGLTTLDSVALQGFTTVDSVAVQGFTAATDLGLAGMNGIQSTADRGFVAVENITTDFSGVAQSYNATISNLFQNLPAPL
jgi:hypothetical protein